MEKAKLNVVWTGGSTIWASENKVQPAHSTEVFWSLFQRRPGLLRRLLPLPVFLAEHLPGNEHTICDRLGIERCSYEELAERYRAGEFHDSPEKEEEVAPAPKEKSLEDLTNAELQDLLRDRGLPIYGAKADLIERLESN